MDGSLAVRFSGNRISPQAALALARLGARQTSDVNAQGAAVFSIPLTSDPRAVAAALHGVTGVIGAGPIIERSALAIPPNDPLFDSVHQWDMYHIQMDNAWTITTAPPPPSVKIAVIDTGYDMFNPDLAGKVDASIVYDKGDGTPDTTASIEDTVGHGSDVSGIAAANTDNGKDVAGIGWNAHLLEARVFTYGPCSGAFSVDIASAVNWAVANGATVINLSLGSSTPDPLVEEPAIEDAINNHHVVVVAAAGNDGTNTIDFPAGYPGVIAVGASAFHDVTKNVLTGGFEYVASYSDYGPGLSLVAPGGDPDANQKNCTTDACIDFLQWIENLDSTKGPFTEEVGLFAGTSQASPHVAGAVALMAYYDQVQFQKILQPARALAILKASADNISDPHQGAGRLNVQAALSQLP